MGGRLLVLIVAAVSACGASEFLCAQDDDCDGAGGGQCVQGYCAFPDDRCPSGLRFSEHSGGLSGKCVDDEGGTGSASDPSTGTTGGPDPSTTSGPPSTSVPPVESSSSDASSGIPEGMVEFRDDELDGEFGAGTFNSTAYAGARLQLEPTSTEGTFVSRVFDAGAPVQWDTLTWAPDAPYSKALPGGGAAESGYGSGNVDMDGNVLLLHFEETELAAGSVVSDASGQSNDGTLTGNADAQSVAGPFGNALEDPLGAYVSIPPNNFSFGTDDFTWAIWFRFTHGCTDNNVFMGVDDAAGGADLHPHLWFGCTIADWTPCGDAPDVPRPAGFLKSVHGAMEGVPFCGPGPVNDGAWHHLAVVKAGHEATAVTTYVDGTAASTALGTFDAPIELTQGGDFAVGGFSEGTYPTQGTFDDAAIWRRALPEERVRALYLRGALQLHLEVRTCQQADCADDPPFVGGPMLAAGSSFTDPDDALGPGTEIPLQGLLEGRWVQYRVSMAAAAQAGTPALAAVAMRGTY